MVITRNDVVNILQLSIRGDLYIMHVNMHMTTACALVGNRMKGRLDVPFLGQSYLRDD